QAGTHGGGGAGGERLLRSYLRQSTHRGSAENSRRRRQRFHAERPRNRRGQKSCDSKGHPHGGGERHRSDRRQRSRTVSRDRRSSSRFRRPARREKCHQPESGKGGRMRSVSLSTIAEW